MPCVSRVRGPHALFQAKVHAHCGECQRGWCYCHEKRSQSFSVKKSGGVFMAEQLARQWCRDVKRANKRREAAYDRSLRFLDKAMS